MKKLILFAFLALAFSCIKKEEDPQVASEKEFQNYLRNNNITTAPTSSGLYYIPSVEGTGLQPVKGNKVENSDVVLINYTGTLLNGKVIETNDSAIALKNGIINATRTNIPLKAYLFNSFFPGLLEGLQMMKEGGKAKMILPSKLANGMYATQTLPYYANLVYNVELVKVIKNPIQADSLLFIQTLQNQGITPDSALASVYYKEITPGTGDTIAVNDTIIYSNIVSIVDGYVANVSASDTIAYDKAIAGLQAGFKKMRSGGKARLFIWQKYGYGASGYFGARQDFYMQQIVPENTSFFMDVEIKEIRHKK